MIIDIYTIIFILGVTHLLQIIVFYHQYRTVREFRGIGWWVVWSASEAVAFSLMFLRDHPALGPYAILFQNIFLAAGTFFIYAGIMRFCERNVRLSVLFSVLAVYALVMAYLTLIKPDFLGRTILSNLLYAGIAYVSAYSLLVQRIRGIRVTARFNAVVFLAHGTFFLVRTLFIISGTPVSQFFTPNLFNFLPFIDALIVSYLWAFGFIIMINQRLHSEMATARNHFESIFKTTPDAVLITRADNGLIIDSNPAFGRMSGYSRNEITGNTTPAIRLWKVPEARQRFVSALQEEGFINNVEAEFFRKNGAGLTGLISARMIDLNGIPCIISVIRDITDRKNVEEQIRRMNADLETRVSERTRALKETNRELESFAYTVAHDLRSPLRAIHAFSTILLEERSQQLGQEGVRQLETIGKNARNLGRLIDDLLAFSRLSRQEISCEEIEMTGLVRDVFNGIASEEDLVRIRFSVQELPSCRADSQMMRQLWSQLLDNAIKFSANRQVSVIEVRGQRDAESFVYSIKDNGIGFEMDYVVKIFEVFHKLQSLDEFAGTGIGLAIVQRIIERHGGKVWATGRPGKGAEFSFSLPVSNNPVKDNNFL